MTDLIKIYETKNIQIFIKTTDLSYWPVQSLDHPSSDFTNLSLPMVVIRDLYERKLSLVSAKDHNIK